MNWIKTTDELPILNKSIIVFNGKVIDDVKYIDHDYKFWCHFYGYDNDSYEIENVTHWMYLPDKPTIIK